MLKRINRRDFLTRTALTAGLGPTVIAATALGNPQTPAPSERVTIGHIGTGGQGRAHATTFDAFEDCDVVALCDVDPKRRAKARSELGKPATAREEPDFRRILDDTRIDSVSIATPDHWHTPIALHALQAGKHVYVEKPCSHNLHEGAVLDRAARHIRSG